MPQKQYLDEINTVTLSETTDGMTYLGSANYQKRQNFFKQEKKSSTIDTINASSRRVQYRKTITGAFEIGQTLDVESRKETTQQSQYSKMSRLKQTSHEFKQPPKPT